MVICFNATKEAHEALARLQATGRYADTAAVISTAICNLEVLDAATQAGGGSVLNPVGMFSPSSITAPKRSDWSPELLKQPKMPFETERFLAAVSPVTMTGELLPPKQWPWGQFNKIFPVKLTCRATINLLLQNPGIKIADAALSVTRSAAEFGRLLRGADSESHRRRDEAFAAALPSDADPADKSFIRFAEQFVYGMGSFAATSYPSMLRLVDVASGSLRLTAAGVRFAELTNPLLDGNPLQSADKFSDQELAFLHEHILTTVPAERSALGAILKAVKQGAVNPEAVDAFLRQLFPEKNEELSDPFLATQRTGAISRAVELKLLRRERSGVRVTYLLEPAAELFLQPQSL
jgi:hypothetical protein